MGDCEMNKSPNLGGGEILELGVKNKEQNPWFNWELINQYDMLDWIKVGIIILLILITVLIILKIFRIRTVMKHKGLANELETIRALRQRDLYVIKANKWMSFITNLFEQSIFKCNKSNKEYIDYNLKRANVRVIGGFRPMVMEEFYSIVKLFTAILCVMGVVLGVAVSPVVGLVVVILSIWGSTILPMIVVRNIVKSRNATVKRNFFDMYCKLHYSLYAGGVTPINKLLSIYAKTTDNPEMLRFVDNCNNLIETYNEYGATTLIADEYREIAEVGKLMRLIKQQADGADIKAELIGFREELIEQEKYRLSVITNKNIAKVKRSFMLLMILLGQVIISAMTIYFPDLGILTSLG